jgi:hypothetical protein
VVCHLVSSDATVSLCTYSANVEVGRIRNKERYFLDETRSLILTGIYVYKYIYMYIYIITY